MSWIPIAEEKQARFAALRGELDERALVRQGNLAYAAALALRMAAAPDADAWFRTAAAQWRRSWDVGGATEAWGRPIGALKASLLAGDGELSEELAHWALELGTATASSPIGRYAGALALLTLDRGGDAHPLAGSLRGRDDFPADVADALEAVAARDVAAYGVAVDSVVASFESRDAYLEDVAVADTALVLGVLARRAGLERPLPPSATLP